MEYQIALSPELDVDVEGFIAAWNATPECRDLAQAQLAAEKAHDMILGPDMILHGLVLLAGAAGGLAVDAVKDIVKEKLTAYLKEKLSREPEIEIQAVRQPGGAYLLVVSEPT